MNFQTKKIHLKSSHLLGLYSNETKCISKQSSLFWWEMCFLLLFLHSRTLLLDRSLYLFDQLTFFKQIDFIFIAAAHTHLNGLVLIKSLQSRNRLPINFYSIKFSYFHKFKIFPFFTKIFTDYQRSVSAWITGSTKTAWSY